MLGGRVDARVTRAGAIPGPTDAHATEHAAVGPDPGLRLGTSWALGFHGAVTASHLDGEGGAVSLSSFALSHRSLGAQRMRSLTELAQPVDLRVVPSSSSGARPTGRASVPRQAGASTPIEPWDRSEPLADYIDRRLAKAELLLLPNRGRGYAFVKRALDLVGAVVLLVLASPVILALVLLVRLDSPGPAIFRQERVTRGGRTFTFYKFRTMWVDARERFPDLYAYQFTGELADTYYKLEDDPRNTRVGRWLRRTTLDELPNLVNVLRGDMSLVGPRPELPELVAFYRPEELSCFFTKAGLTGLAQVAGRSLLTVRERLTLDLRYVAHQTVLLDLRILWRTVLVVLLRRGAF
jgi:lipopolysaccharide/colanic/teichoic acid biosynthesis glycosyltransferase